MFDKSVLRSLSLISQIGITMISPILLCTFAAYWLERRFNLVLTIPLLILGVLSGMNMVYRLIMSFLKRQRLEELEKEEKKNMEKKEVIKPKEKSRIFKEEIDE